MTGRCCGIDHRPTGASGRQCRSVTRAVSAVCLFVCPCLLSVSLSTKYSIKSICCSRAQLGRARTWTRPIPVPVPVLVHTLGTLHCNCDPSVPYLPTCLLPRYRTYLLYPHRSRYFSLFSFSNSIFFFPPFLSSTRHSCPVLHLSSYPSLLFPLDGPGAYALSWPDTNSTSIRDPGAVRVERSRLGIYNLQLKEPGRCSSTAEPCPAATAALIEQRATNATRARLARF